MVSPGGLDISSNKYCKWIQINLGLLSFCERVTGSCLRTKAFDLLVIMLGDGYGFRGFYFLRIELRKPSLVK